ncbi:hypothetical protein DFH09DRAFT_649239 [Mycena vulgaris]|nr:hypothetical protein DFH09DRAFT_649239 [Mycena vulgaris]
MGVTGRDFLVDVFPTCHVRPWCLRRHRRDALPNRSLRRVALTYRARCAAPPTALLPPRGTDTDTPGWRTDTACPRPHTATGRPRRTDMRRTEKRTGSRRRVRGGDRPVLLLLGIRLGLDGVDPVYDETIKILHTFLQSAGITGGRPSSSYYFVGALSDGLFYFGTTRAPRCHSGHSYPRRTI